MAKQPTFLDHAHALGDLIRGAGLWGESKHDPAAAEQAANLCLNLIALYLELLLGRPATPDEVELVITPY